MAARLIGFYRVVVDLRYEVPPEFIQRSGGKSYRHYENHVEVTACGKRGEIFGEFRDPGK